MWGGVVEQREKIEYPPELSEMERKLVNRELDPIEPAARQQIVDVLAANLQRGTVRSAVGLLRGIVRRYREGAFDPTPGLPIARARAQAATRVIRPPPAPAPDTDAVLREHARKLGIPEAEYLRRFGREQA